MSREALHPFLGFVQDPGVREITTSKGRQTLRTVDSAGFVRHTTRAGSGPPFHVALLGGSVALQLAATAGDELATGLRRLPRLADRTVVVRNLAMGGYKQPQQLMALAWEVSLGHRPDLVLNLDGYNDLVLGYTENLQEGVFPFYPRGWRWRTANSPDLGLQAAVGKVVYLREERERRRAAFEGSLLSRSSLATLAWQRLDKAMEQQLVAAEREARTRSRELAERERSFATHGPGVGPADTGAYVESAAGVWQRSSLAIAGICQAVGCDYLHFLQPNLHDEGSKPLTGGERALAAAADPLVAELVRRGYPELAARGARLRAQGLSFEDLRAAFADRTGGAYVDSCCHMTGDAYRVLAGRMVEAVRRVLAARSAPVGVSSSAPASRRAP
jgi:hypothetical protein